MNPLKFFWGLVAILGGFLLLATNAGWISTGVWWSILLLWPVILIVLGLKLLLHNNDTLFMWLTLVIVLLSAAYVLAVNQNKWQLGFLEQSHIKVGTNVFSESFSDNFEVASVKNLKFTLNTGAAEVNLSSLPQTAAQDALYQVKTQDMGKLKISRNVSGDTATLTIDEEGNGLPVAQGFVGLNRKIDVYLPASLLVNLDLSSGASKLNVDFSNLKTENVKFSIGASSGEIVLSDKVARQSFVVEAGASSLSFKVPKTLGVKATIEGGLNSVNSDSSLGFSKSGETYTTSGFDASVNQLILNCSSGVSSIKFLQK